MEFIDNYAPVDFHHRLTAYPSYEKSRSSDRQDHCMETSAEQYCCTHTCAKISTPT